MTDPHGAVLARPSAWTVQYRCACGWASDTVPSEQLSVIGAQLVRHMKGA